ncbi:siderophore-iron reductase FhuF [Jeongeupia wiesaeckerbachi]|uniref:siderophore-iron reductase FhuF n=1 Tax=Jeongeupia wiesaeckerbachi TaxID=3051218 RepID=UPI003D8054F9
MSTPPDLASLVPEIHAEYCRSLRLGEPVQPVRGQLVPATRLLEHKDAMLAAMQAIYQGDDERALLSQWTKYYIDIVLQPALIAAVVLGRPLAMALENSTLELHGGMPQAVWLPADALGDVIEDPAMRYRSLCVEHLAPLFDAFGAAVRLSHKVFWNNAGNSLEYDLVTLFDDERARADRRYLFEGRHFFDTGRSNPMRQVIRYADTDRPQLDSPFRARKVCCLRDRLPDEIGLCSSCPLLLTLPEAELAAQVRLMKEVSEE